MPEAFIRSLVKAKTAAAKANGELEQIPSDMAKAISDAADKLLVSEDLMQHFPVDVYQTGSGTSSNMNANEVLATLATELYKDSVSANDHINCGQSSNDIIPSTIHISAAIELNEQLLPALEYLVQTTREKAKSVDQYVKTGRTHLMDAMPVRMSQSLNSWATQI
ncbi:lyase family protein, partial [Oleiphilus sp. HI0066]|uniref:lyase family protein n=2 Tax=Oleiphilus TaxID=141450 RepID=UPI003514F9B4